MLDLTEYRLNNGLRVVLNEDHSAPLVAINLWYHVGSKNERPGRTGFAHLFEHMLFSGSEHVGNNEHFRYVQSVGGVALTTLLAFTLGMASTGTERKSSVSTAKSASLPDSIEPR